ncbi:c-type cytochrome [Jhaorihella thermophila]
MAPRAPRLEIMRLVLFCLSLMLTASPSVAQEALGLTAPPDVTESGLLKHILPRFSLKTGVRVVADPSGPMVLAEGPPGTPVLKRGDRIYYLRVTEDRRQQRFLDWMLSEIGKRTIESFAPGGETPFTTDFAVEIATIETKFTGDAARGADLALKNCGRCHVIGPQKPMAGISSTPSFPALRALPDWSERFETFYVRNPHPAFLQLEGISPAFDPERPPPIVPLTITHEEFEAILAFVEATEPADLGAPLKIE